MSSRRSWSPVGAVEIFAIGRGENGQTVRAAVVLVSVAMFVSACSEPLEFADWAIDVPARTRILVTDSRNMRVSAWSADGGLIEDRKPEGLMQFLSITAASEVAVATQQEPGLPLCVVSDDSTFAYTRENPVRIGGGARVVAAREQRYMDALRGPGGEELTYTRRGSGPGPDETVLDIYEVSYEGLDEPLTMFLDAYRWTEPEAPKGLSCGRPFNLPVPAPDPFGVAEDPPAAALRVPPPGGAVSGRGPGGPRSLAEIDTALNELATAYALEDRTLDPIPLDPERPELGVVLSPFHRKVLTARAEVAAGRTPDLPLEMGPNIVPQGGNTIVAYPVSCQGGTAFPREVAYVGMTAPGQTGEVRATREAMSGPDIRRFLPGFEAPAGALAKVFFPSRFNRGDIAIVRYDGASCSGLDEEVRLPLQVSLPRPLKQVHAPDSVDVTAVRVRGMIDVDGVPRRVVVSEGIPPLNDKAVRLASEWRWRPHMVNGTPVPLAIGFVIRFGSRENKACEAR